MTVLQILARTDCDTGYTSTNCDIEIDYCDPNPCGESGICTSITNQADFSCQCLPGMTGQRCEDDINECLQQQQQQLTNEGPCQNGGTCLNSHGSFLCNCSGTGYDGPLCSEPTDPAPPDQGPEDDSDITLPLVIGVAAGGSILLAILVIVVIIVAVWRVRRYKKRHESYSPKEAELGSISIYSLPPTDSPKERLI